MKKRILIWVIVSIAAGVGLSAIPAGSDFSNCGSCKTTITGFPFSHAARAEHIMSSDAFLQKVANDPACRQKDKFSIPPTYYPCNMTKNGAGISPLNSFTPLLNMVSVAILFILGELLFRLFRKRLPPQNTTMP